MLDVFRKIWNFSRKEQSNLRKSMIIGFVNAMFYSLLVGAMYVALKAIVEGSMSYATAWTTLGIMVLSIVGRIVTQYYSQLQRTHAGYFMSADKRLAIGKKLKTVPMGYFNRNSLGRITAIETTILNDVENAVPVVLIITLGGFLNTSVFSLFLLVFDWRIGLITILGIAVFLVVTSAMERKSRKDVPLRQDAQENLVDKVLETILGMSVVKAFNLTGKLDKKVDKAIEESHRRNEKVEKAMTPYVFLQQLTLYGFSVLILFSAISFHINGSLPLPETFMIIVCSFLVYEQLKVAGSAIANLRIAETSMDKANEIEKVPVMKEGNVERMPGNADIVFENVDFAYEDKKILDDVSVTIPANELTAIVGPSGSGKTTLCSLISRFWDVDSGRITIGGVDVRDYRLPRLMEQISVVFQDTYLFRDTVENNIRFGRPDATHEDVVAAATRACCHDFIMALPDGYDTVIGEGGATLSGGERQRIAIARALIKDASIVIFDEATANVDPENEDHLQKAMEELTRDKTVIMIAHRLKTVRHAKQILVLNDGKIVQQGTHQELADQPGIYADFLSQRKKAIGWKLEKHR